MRRVRQLLHGLRPASLGRELMRGSVASAVVRAGAMLVTLGVAVVLARALGPEQYGVYAYVYAVVTILAIPGQFGLPFLITRETARSQARADWSRLKGVWRWSWRVGAASSAILILGGTAVAVLYADAFGNPQITAFAWGLALLPGIVLIGLHGAVLRGLRNVVLGGFVQQALRQSLLLIAVGGALALGLKTDWTASDAMAVHAMVALTGVLLASLLIQRVRPSETRRRLAPTYEHSAWFKAILPLAAVGGMQMLLQQTDLIMLGWFTEADRVGLYRVAAQTAALASFALTVINLVVAPYFARLHTNGEHARLQRLVTLSALAVTTFSVPACGVLIAFGGPLLTLVFGADYAGAAATLAILALGRLATAAFGSVGLLLTMTGYERDAARVLAVAALVNVAGNLILIPNYAELGAAAAMSLSLLLWNGLMWWAVRRRLGIDSTALPLRVRPA